MIMISEELPELIGMSDRILIMKNHEIVQEIPRSAKSMKISSSAA